MHPGSNGGTPNSDWELPTRTHDGCSGSLVQTRHTGPPPGVIAVLGVKECLLLLPPRDVVEATARDSPTRGRRVDPKNTTSAEEVPDARRALLS